MSNSEILLRNILIIVPNIYIIILFIIIQFRASKLKPVLSFKQILIPASILVVFIIFAYIFFKILPDDSVLFNGIFFSITIIIAVENTVKKHKRSPPTTQNIAQIDQKISNDVK
ncbi:MAG: hypothetical protein ACFFC3_06195 [Candidatus Odinarchaeota archaeon]